MSSKEELLGKLHAETALIGWRDLQRFFAQGKVLLLDPDDDLVQIATLFADDDADTLKPLLESGRLTAPDNARARQWYTDNAELWCVVVAPFVLVQESLETSS